MYGVKWCPACYVQKEKIFGPESWQVLKNNYFDCEGSEVEQRLCQAKKIDVYPFWEFKDGKSRIGWQYLEDLAAISGCR